MKMTMLVSSCGRRVQLIEAFRTDARDLGVDLRVVGIDVHPVHSAAAMVADASYRVPSVQNERFLPSVRQICADEHVSLVLPTIDPELILYAQQAEAFYRAGTTVSISSMRLIKMMCDKMETYQWLTGAGIRTPHTMPMEEVRRFFGNIEFPVIAKPVCGSGSVGVKVLRDATELFDAPLDSGYLIQEFIEGVEYTVNMFFSLGTGRLHCVIPHRRIEVRAGEVAKGQTVRHPALEALGWKIGEAFAGAARGCICFQAIENSRGEIFVIEINGRFGGGFPLAHHAGARMSRWLLEEVQGLPLSAGNDWNGDVMMSRYDAAFYVEK